MCWGIQYMGNQEALRQKPQNKKGGNGEEKGEVRVNSQENEQPISGEHAQHHERTVSEIDNLHDSEDQRQADRYQTVDPSHKNPADDRLEEKRKTRKAHKLLLTDNAAAYKLADQNILT